MTHLDAPRRFDAQRDGATILFGAGRFAELGERLGAAGAERVLVVTTPGRRALGERALALLGERGFGLFADARAHVPRATVEAARAQVASVDAVLTIGGGSATGLGKALA
ncbi:MAG TPA: iron-containing alcohol dehydrogenase, partial [Polyangiaceae bacterium LLY-WYZ-15_(1-7)]|nr:iron-containing alcohol dehydrogenase [Polyangiaceae bacterium LLY-WYZ-15_(1-7)]